MKHIFFLAVLIVFSLAAGAQSKITPKKNYQQKRYLDSLQKTFRQPAIQINPQPILAYNTPGALLKNEGAKVGMSGEDTIYRMKTDQMRILKPNSKANYIPNAADGKIFMVPPAKNKP